MKSIIFVPFASGILSDSILFLLFLDFFLNRISFLVENLFERNLSDMKITLHTIWQNFSKFLHLRRMEEHSFLFEKNFIHGLNPNGTLQLFNYRNHSPRKILVVDVDQTILIAHNRDYEHAEPIQPVIDKINYLFSQGWKIIIFSARGQLSMNGNMDQIEKKNRPVLEKWLKEHNVKYTALRFCKPYGAYYLDDKALTPDEFLSRDLQEEFRQQNFS